jgi:pimeloyl-ACP methyl ester carboxylesterase
MPGKRGDKPGKTAPPYPELRGNRTIIGDALLPKACRDSRERVIRGRLFKAGLIAAAMLGAAVIAFLGWRAARQHQLAAQLRIDPARGIAEEGFVKIGSIRQWVQIRGDDRRNPVLLVVHGGPGVSLMAYTPLFRDWERNFTVVQWDQRGDGKTFGGNPRPALDDMRISRIAQDGVELTDYLRGRLHQSKVVLLGHSWGGAVALTMVHARPDLFSAFVAAGFIVSERDDWRAGYDVLLARARADRNAQAVSELTAIGPPPYQGAAAERMRGKWISHYDHRAEKRLVRRAWKMALFAPNYSWKDIWDFFAAMRFSAATADKWLDAFDARALGNRIAVPVWFLEGDRDFTTPIPIVRDYFNKLSAPEKHFVVLPGSGHSALLTDPDEIGEVLGRQVRPVVVRAGKTSTP